MSEQPKLSLEDLLSRNWACRYYFEPRPVWFNRRMLSWGRVQRRETKLRRWADFLSPKRGRKDG